MKINRRSVLGAMVLLAACMLGNVHADPQTIVGIDLPDKAQGEAALAALGANLPAVARAYGISIEEIERRFRDDRHMTVDRHGYLFYEDHFDIPGDAPAATRSEP